MEPQIQYAQAEDGVNIAYYTLGSGPPLINLPSGPFGNVQVEWRVLQGRTFMEMLAERHTVVRFDGRNVGLSDEAADLSLDKFSGDVEAVANHLGLGQFDLLASALGVPIGITYAARHPERLNHLILNTGAARGASFYGHPRDRVLGAMMDADWELYTDAVTHLTYGWSAGDAARQFAEAMRESQTPESARALGRAFFAFDSTELLSAVQCPTLVMHSQGARVPTAASARELAANIPDARLVMLDEDTPILYMTDLGRARNLIEDFLSDGGPALASANANEETGGLRIVLFTDIEASTQLTDRLGDEKARDVIRGHEAVVREALAKHSGSEVKTMGDGFMVSFTSASQALDCAIAIQRANDAANTGADEPLHVRVGLNAGEPIAEQDDLFGTTVIRAARIAAIADGGEILVSNVVRELSEGKSYLFTDRGDAPLRGFEETVRIYELGWRQSE